MYNSDRVENDHTHRMRVKELKAECRKRGLARGDNKPQLLSRLREDEVSPATIQSVHTHIKHTKYKKRNKSGNTHV